MLKAPYSQQREARQQNTSVLLRDLWRHGPLSQAMLAQRNGLTKATVSAICADLASLGLIRAAGQDRTGLGRPGKLLELNPLARCAIGVEISTDYSAAVLTDLCGEPWWQGSVLTPPGSDQEAVLAQAETLVAEAIDRAQARGIPLLGIGVGIPGTVDPGPQSLVSAPSLGWKALALKQFFEQRFALPVIVENKARVAAMAEGLSGSAQGVGSFVYVSIGDVGASIEAAVVNNGFPHRGLAVDAGHMILDPNGPLCACGQRGCWQAMVNAQREVELARVRLAAGESSVLHADLAGAMLDHHAIHQAAAEGDALARAVLRTVQLSHALGIANLVHIFDPQLVVIGWASAALSDAHHTHMRALGAELDLPAAVSQQMAQRGVTPPAIVHAAHGSEAFRLGAAALLVDELLQTPPGVEA